MTITPEAPTLNAPVDVRFTAAGTPLAAEPLHWFTRDSWWETRRSVPVGVGNVVDIKHWRVQV